MIQVIGTVLVYAALVLAVVLVQELRREIELVRELREWLMEYARAALEVDGRAPPRPLPGDEWRDRDS